MFIACFYLNLFIRTDILVISVDMPFDVEKVCTREIETRLKLKREIGILIFMFNEYSKHLWVSNTMN